MEQQRSAGAQNIRNVFAGVVDGVDMSSGYMGLGGGGFYSCAWALLFCHGSDWFLSPDYAAPFQHKPITQQLNMSAGFECCHHLCL